MVESDKLRIWEVTKVSVKLKSFKERCKQLVKTAANQNA